MLYNYEYSSKNDIIRANNPVASERANPRIAYENNCGRNASHYPDFYSFRYGIV